MGTRKFKRRRSRLTITGRIPGGLRGFLAAVSSWLDPDKPEPEWTAHRLSQHGSDARQRRRRARQREKGLASRTPF